MPPSFLVANTKNFTHTGQVLILLLTTYTVTCPGRGHTRHIRNIALLDNYDSIPNYKKENMNTTWAYKVYTKYNVAGQLRQYSELQKRKNEYYTANNKKLL